MPTTSAARSSTAIEPDYEAAIGEINKTILDTFRARSIGIAVPQREVRMLGSGEPAPIAVKPARAAADSQSQRAGTQ